MITFMIGLFCNEKMHEGSHNIAALKCFVRRPTAQIAPERTTRRMSGLDIRLVDAVARGASRFENLLAPPKSYWPPKKTNWPLPQNQTCAMKKIFA